MHVHAFVAGICSLVVLISSELSVELCDTARLTCSARDGCQMALTNFFVGCSDVIYGEAKYCTTKCEHALISLLSTEDKTGLAFMNCNCNGNAFCQERKSRVEVCTRVVLQAMTNLENTDHSISCNLAQWICEADTSCLTALDYYAQHCGKLLSTDTCTSRCNNSLHILYRQKNAKKLPTCYCDGKEEYNCHKLKYNTEKYCFHREPEIPYIPRTQAPSHSNNRKNSGRKKHSSKGKPRKRRNRRWFRSSHSRLRKMLKQLLKGQRKRRRNHLRRRRRDRRKKKRRRIPE